jgi:hypothetical protein
VTAVIVFYDQDLRIVAFAAAPADPSAATVGIRAAGEIASVRVELTPEQERLPLTRLLSSYRPDLQGEPRLVPLGGRAATGAGAVAEEEADLPEPTPTRYEALVLTGSTRVALSAVADLDLDRLPDPGGRVRVLISADEARELVDRGYEVRMMNALDVRPLDPKLVMSDEQAEAWFTERTTGVRRQEES